MRVAYLSQNQLRCMKASIVGKSNFLDELMIKREIQHLFCPYYFLKVLIAEILDLLTL